MARSITLSIHSMNDLKSNITAIKGVRQLSRLGLKEAKELVDRLNPGHVEVLKIDSSVLEPYYGDAITMIRSSGLRVKITAHNSKARDDIAEQIRGIVTYATMSGQYDIGRALLDVMETYCPVYENEGNEDDENNR